jgi:hypothetical protein
VQKSVTIPSRCARIVFNRFSSAFTEKQRTKSISGQELPRFRTPTCRSTLHGPSGSPFNDNGNAYKMLHGSHDGARKPTWQNLCPRRREQIPWLSSSLPNERVSSAGVTLARRRGTSALPNATGNAAAATTMTTETLYRCTVVHGSGDWTSWPDARVYAGHDVHDEEPRHLLNEEKNALAAFISCVLLLLPSSSPVPPAPPLPIPLLSSPRTPPAG